MSKNNQTEEKVSSFKTWKQIIPFAFPYAKLIIVLALLMIVTAVIDVITPLFTGYAVSNFIEPQTLDGVWKFLAFMLFIASMQVVTTLLLAMFALRVEMYVARDLRNALYSHLQTLSFDYYNSTPVGTILARVMSDTNRIGSVFAWSPVDIVWSFASIVGYMTIMCIMNIKLALLVIIIIPIIAIITWFFQNKILKANRDVRTQNAEITRHYNEGISGAKTSKTMVIEQKNVRAFNGVAYKMKTTSIKSVMLGAIYIPLVSAIASLSVALVLSSGGNMILDGSIELAELTIFINYALVISSPVQQLASTLSGLIATQVNVERCNHILNLKPLVKDRADVVEKYGDFYNPKTENFEELKGDIKFENLTFMYHDGTENVLENFNLHVNAGTTVAIVGETGAGKSTLVNLACRFFEPSSGRILIDDKDYLDRSLYWLHSNIGYVLQTPHLFSGSIKENIRYGNPNASDEDVINAAKMVHAHEAILHMKDGYDTDTGEGGDQLSTGQKQLISFARAIIANPKIFILDEATSSIDTETEALIQDAISNLLGTRTSFIIAHRLSTIRKADVILVVKNGKIIEQGTHHSLLESKGYYSELYNKQFDDGSKDKFYKE